MRRSKNNKRGRNVGKSEKTLRVAVTTGCREIRGKPHIKLWLGFAGVL